MANVITNHTESKKYVNTYQNYNRPPAGEFDGPSDKPNLLDKEWAMALKFITNTRVELPATAYRLDGQKVRTLISSL
jgi:hypothetical protein